MLVAACQRLCWLRRDVWEGLSPRGQHLCRHIVADPGEELVVGWDGAPSYITESDLSLEQLQKFRANPASLSCVAGSCAGLPMAELGVACAGEGRWRRLAHRYVAAGLCSQIVKRNCEAGRAN